MKWINAEQQVTVTIYDEEHEEHLDKIMTVEEMLDAYTNEGCPTIYSNPERKTGEWIEKTEVVDCSTFHDRRCSLCGCWVGMSRPNFCPNCGADMRGEQDE